MGPEAVRTLWKWRQISCPFREWNHNSVVIRTLGLLLCQQRCCGFMSKLMNQKKHLKRKFDSWKRSPILLCFRVSFWINDLLIIVGRHVLSWRYTGTYVHSDVEKLGNWNPVLIGTVFLICTSFPVLFHGNPLSSFLPFVPNQLCDSCCPQRHCIDSWSLASSSVQRGMAWDTWVLGHDPV